MLLKKYGGLYLDSDIIVMKDLISIIEKLNDFDFVGFGCTGFNCKYGYANPSNWLLASRPNTKLMNMILHEQLEIINKNNNNNTNLDYHDIGKNLIWKSLNYLIITENYEYFHYPNTIDGTRDVNGNWVDSDIIFSNNPIQYDIDINDFFIYVLYYSNINDDIKNMSREELLNKKMNFSKCAKIALNC